jgi:transcriptional/translational regulatory protein YebC/TACO1
MTPHALIQRRFAGHNKWSKIRHKKAAADQEKSLRFAKLSLEIISAIKGTFINLHLAFATYHVYTLYKEKGPDPSLNLRLSLALNKARDSNMPKANIENALARVFET